MKKIGQFIRENLKGGKACVLVTIISSEGSSPRGAGTNMAVSQNGDCCGTIGGGAVEHRVTGMAKEIMESRRSRAEYFMLNRDDVRNLGMICGGDIRVYLQYIGASEENMKLYEEICRAAESNENRWVVFEIDGEQQCSASILSREGVIYGQTSSSQYLDRLTNLTVGAWNEKGSYYIQPLAVKGQVYIFGGGHIARKLVPILASVDFSCIVYDSMEEFTRLEDFPQAKAVICGDFAQIDQHLSIGRDDYVVIMTRGHAYDYTVLRQVLAKHTLYTGMIGSRSKVKTTNEKLMGDGYTETDIARIHSPIGLAIKADTPAEISISIAAEMIEVRATARQEKQL